MTFSELKAAVLANTRPLEICEAYQEAQIAANYAALIDAGLKAPVWAYQSGVITDTLLAEIPEADLNAKGIYTSGTFSLTNPGFDEIYILKTANVTLTLDGNNKLSAVAMGGAMLTAGLADNAHFKFKAFNTSQNAITLEDASTACLELVDSSVNNVTAGDDSTCHIVSRANAQISVNAGGSSLAKVTMFGHSAGTYGVSGAGEIIENIYQAASLNLAT